MRYLLYIVLCLTPTTLLAAVDGVVGATSTGSLQIRLRVPAEVRVSQLRDIAFDAQPGAVSTGSSPVCIYRSGTGAYQVTAIGSGAGGAFELGNGQAQVPYEVRFSDGTSNRSLRSGEPLTGRSGADPASPDCIGTGQNARVDVRLEPAATDPLDGGDYVGTLTLVVAPD